jgi:regulator of sigma E protease
MLISLIAFSVAFTLVVIIHELGHFIAAKMAGIKVYEFSLGFAFSKKIATLFRYKETEFTLRAIPLGGATRFSGEDDPDAKEFFKVPCAQRLAIIIAGVVFNIILTFLVFTIVFILGRKLGILDAMFLSAKNMCHIFTSTFFFIQKLISGTGSLNNFAGPVGMATTAGAVASMGILHLLYFTGLLSISIAIINMLPLPSLDGGQAVMTFVEWVKGKAISPRIYRFVNMAGMILLLIFTVVITAKDIICP